MRRRKRTVDTVRFGPKARVTAAMVAADGAPGVPKACVTVTDTHRTWLVEFSDRDRAVLILAAALNAIFDLEADLDRVPPPIDLATIREIRAVESGRR